MTAPNCLPDEFITRVETLRALQVKYFAISSGRLEGTTGAERAKCLRECKCAEAEIDQWIALYRAEQARWRAWVLSQQSQPSEADLESLHNTVEGQRPDLGRLFK